ncbi:MAG TPA: DUF5320 domain-containing protein [Dehalococcoidia bacterium]|nr:DUF5320 domain-containing protein [Dehalococcoidia bacterium]
MPGFDGTGPRGMGPMTGGGRGFCSPWSIGRMYGFGRGYGFGMGMPYAGPAPYSYAGAPTGTVPYGGMAYPGAMPYGYAGATMGAVPGADPYAPQMTRKQELDFLRSQAEAIKGQLEQIDAGIKELETE